MKGQQLYVRAYDVRSGNPNYTITCLPHELRRLKVFYREFLTELSEAVNNFGDGAELDITRCSDTMYDKHQMVDLITLSIGDFW